MGENIIRVSLTREAAQWLSEHCRMVIVLDSQMTEARTLPDRTGKVLRHEIGIAAAALSSLQEGMDNEPS